MSRSDQRVPEDFPGDDFDAAGRGDSMHQAPNPADLRRSPPASPDCARVRGWLRDFADGDLEAAKADAVDDHVHRCRVCALELARAEHEVLRLRRAYQSYAVDPVPPGFARRVIDRLVLDETDLSLPAAVPGSDAGGRVAGGRVAGGAAGGAGAKGILPLRLPDVARGGAGRDGSRTNRMAGNNPASLLVAALAALFVLALGVRFLRDAEDGPHNEARFVVLDADGTFNGRQQAVGRGDRLREHDAMWVARGGAARFYWHDPSPRSQPAATINLESGEVQLKDGAPLLVDGRVLIETNRDVAIPMADGSRIELGLGEYVIAAEIPLDMVDGRPDSIEDGDLLAGMPRIQVEVLSGQPARVLRPGVGPTLVQAGQFGVYQGGGMISVGPSGPVAAAGKGGGRVEAPVVAPEAPAIVLGQVVDGQGLPNAGATVLLSFAREGQQRVVAAQTSSDGHFELPGEQSESSFAIAMAIPSELRLDLGVQVPQAVPLLLNDRIAQLGWPMMLEQSVPVFGVVRDENGQTCAGVRVIPCIVDELFSVVWEIPGPGIRTVTDLSGAFQVRRLPARLAPHQTLAMLLAHDDLEPLVVPVPARGSLVASPDNLAVRMRRLRQVALRGLPQSAVVTVYEEVPGLRAGTAAVRRTAQSDAEGQVEALAVGRGRLWLRIGPDHLPKLTELTLEDGGVSVGAPLPTYRPTGAQADFEQRFGPLLAVDDSGLNLAGGHRHQRFATVKPEGLVSGRTLEVFNANGLGEGEAGAQVFAVDSMGPRGNARMRFVGFTSMTGSISLEYLEDVEDVLVIGSSGTVGWLENPRGGPWNQTLALRGNGSVWLHESLRPPVNSIERVVPIRFVRESSQSLPGTAPVAVRFAGDGNGWTVADLPPGTYRAELKGTSRNIVVPMNGYAVLQ